MTDTFDTTGKALREHIEDLRRLGVSGRAAMTFELSDAMRQKVKDGIRDRHPDWDEGQVKQEFLRVTLGDELYNEAFGKSRSKNE